MKKINFTHPALTDEETDKPIVLKVQAQRVVCPCCEGEGRTDRRDIDTSRLVENMEEDGDFEGLEAYEKGAFSQTCPQCKGLRIVDEVNWEAFHRDFPNETKEIEFWEKCEREDNEYAAQERRVGA